MTNKKTSGMKSAYELAMERLEKSEGASKPLTAEQKEAIAEIDRKAKAEVAQIEIMAQKDLAEARAAGDGEKIRTIEAERARAMERARNRAEEDKEAVRRASPQT
jgi:hypothetical protein